MVTVREDTVLVEAPLRGGGPPNLLEELTTAVRSARGPEVKIDLSRQASIDSLGAALLAEVVVRARSGGKNVSLVGSSADVERGLERFFYPAPEVVVPAEPRRPVEELGAGALRLWDAAGDLALLTSEAVYWSIAALWRGEGHRRGAVTAQALQIGVGAFPIVALISFLVGIVMVLQSADFLRKFGAAILVADGLVLAMMREMGPLMTAILLAGRSGAAIAAEVATMTVSEEMDALRTMGLNPIRFVVVPKMWGITFTMPLLSVMASVIGVFGGFVVAVASLGLPPQAFFKEAVEALRGYDLFTGLAKGLVFAWLIVILATYFGMRVRGGAEGVGRATTSAVVATIFAVIVADAGLGLVFYL